MRFIGLASLVLSSTVPAIAATTLCQRSCESALSYIKFSGNTTKAQCTNQLHIISYFACLERYCPQQIQDGYADLRESCGSTIVPEFGNITTSPLDSLPEFALKDIRKKTSHAGILSPSLYALSKRTITSASEADDLNVLYGNALYGFWAGLILLACLARTWKWTEPRLPAVMHFRWLQSPWPRALINGTKRHLLIPKLLERQNERIDGWCAFPTRLQSLVVFSYVALNVILHLVQHDVFEGNLKRPRISAQVARSLGHRTGTLVMANLPIMWTFAMRNNVLAWFSGWNFATFNVYHRWIARVIVAELIAHAVAYTLVMYDSGGSIKYMAQWSMVYWILGVLALIAGCIMCVAAMYPLRRRFYDAFLFVHIMLALVFLIGAWFHLKKSDKNFVFYFWPCVAVWAFDRAMRYGRLVTLNRSLGQAVVTYDPDSDILRLDVPTRTIVRPQAGTYYYIYVIHGPKFWESHPFTLSSWTVAQENDTRKATLQFLIRPLAGFTARLKSMALQNVDSKNDANMPKGCRLLALVEGPYGHTSITVALGHLQSLISKFEREGHVSIQKIRIIWVVRRADLASSVLESDIIPRLTASGLETKVEFRFETYITQRSVKASAQDEKPGQIPITDRTSSDLSVNPTTEKDTTMSIDIRSDSGEVGPETTSVPTVQYRDGRPPLQDILTEFAHHGSASTGKTAVICCGPTAMSDEVGLLIAQALKNGDDKMDYFPESFSW